MQQAIWDSEESDGEAAAAAAAAAAEVAAEENDAIAKKPIADRLETMVNNERAADFHFTITDDGDRRVPAHKLVVSLGSEELYKMVYGSDTLPGVSDGSTIRVNEISTAAFLKVLLYLYTDKIDFTDLNLCEVFDILKKANYYNLPYFLRQCSAHLCAKMTPDVCLPIYAATHAVALFPALKQHCLQLIRFAPGRYAFGHEQWHETSPEALREILASEALNCDEESLLRATFDWAEKRCVARKNANANTIAETADEPVVEVPKKETGTKRKTTSSSSTASPMAALWQATCEWVGYGADKSTNASSAVPIAEMRTEIGTMLSDCIRWGTMRPTVFNRCIAVLPGFFTAQQTTELRRRYNPALPLRPWLTYRDQVKSQPETKSHDDDDGSPSEAEILHINAQRFQPYSREKHGAESNALQMDGNHDYATVEWDANNVPTLPRRAVVLVDRRRACQKHCRQHQHATSLGRVQRAGNYYLVQIDWSRRHIQMPTLTGGACVMPLQPSVRCEVVVCRNHNVSMEERTLAHELVDGRVRVRFSPAVYNECTPPPPDAYQLPTNSAAASPLRPVFYLGTAVYGKDTLPARIDADTCSAYVTHNGGQHRVSRYEYVRGIDAALVSWKRARGGQVPAMALPCGRTATDEPLYVARVRGNEYASSPDEWLVGKLQPSLRVAKFGLVSSEISRSDYEVLVVANPQVD